MTPSKNTFLLRYQTKTMMICTKINQLTCPFCVISIHLQVHTPTDPSHIILPIYPNGVSI